MLICPESGVFPFVPDDVMKTTWRSICRMFGTLSGLNTYLLLAIVCLFLWTWWGVGDGGCFGISASCGSGRREKWAEAWAGPGQEAHRQKSTVFGKLIICSCHLYSWLKEKKKRPKTHKPLRLEDKRRKKEEEEDTEGKWWEMLILLLWAYRESFHVIAYLNLCCLKKGNSAEKNKQTKK